MLIRTPLAFIVGVFLYIASVYEGGESLMFQPFIASAFTAVVLGVVILLGSPLLLESKWMRWSQLGWYSVLIPALGLLLYACSDLPGIAVVDFHPDSGELFNFRNPIVLAAGWGLTLFGLAYCPKIGFGPGDERRWY